MSEVEKVIQGLENAVAVAEGKAEPARVRAHAVDAVNVCDLRSSLGYSQAQFALHFGFPLSTVRNWEQGRRQPRGAANLLLKVIETQPEIVEALVHEREEAEMASDNETALAID